MNLEPAGAFVSLAVAGIALVWLVITKFSHRRLHRDVRALVHLTQQSDSDAEPRPIRTAALREISNTYSDALRGASSAAASALRDPLTGLANRAAFHTALRAATGEAEGCALLFLDLDRFKAINDTLGHQIGDELLRAVASRLNSVGSTAGVVARLGGDEFTVLTVGPSAEADATAIATTLLETMQAPFTVGGYELFVDVSVGMSSSRIDHPLAPTELLRRADIALYRAKTEPRSHIVVYHDSFDEFLRERLQLSNDLRKALNGDQIEVFYQPEVDLTTGDIVGVEALVRWKHSRLGTLAPADFLDIALENGELSAIDSFVMAEACKSIARLDKAPIVPSHRMFVGVNVEARELVSDGFIRAVGRALQGSGLEPGRLRVEITESAILNHLDQAASVVSALRKIGVKVAIDDFGTGYSSLAYLDKIDFDCVKIDKSFVASIPNNKKSLAIVHSICSLTAGIGASVTGEGIESTEQLEALVAAGCLRGQGFLFSPPVPLKDLLRMARFPRIVSGDKRKVA